MSALPAIGTLYLDPLTGAAYRLRSYGIDWRADPFTGIPHKPDYSVLYADGLSSAARELPESARPVWTPEATS